MSTPFPITWCRPPWAALGMIVCVASIIVIACVGDLGLENEVQMESNDGTKLYDKNGEAVMTSEPNERGVLLLVLCAAYCGASGGPIRHALLTSQRP